VTASEWDFPCCNTPTPPTGHPAPITGDDYAIAVWRDRGARIAALEAENAQLRFDLDAERQQYVELRAELADATTAAQNLRDERTVKFWRRKPRHVHQYVRVGYGGAGWWLFRCATCGATEIDT